MLVLKTILFILVVPGSTIVIIPYYLLNSGYELFALNLGFLRLFGVFPIVTGLAIAFWCVWDFVFTGKGTPSPIDPPKNLVKKGLYQFVRNPMYLGAASILLGEVLLFGSAALFVYAIFVVLVFHLFVTCYEEPVLKRKFGDSYKDYFISVPRWIPQLNLFKAVPKKNSS
jgi:protein-S-isoprenylcysteine O-methyltransferase Ste14